MNFPGPSALVKTREQRDRKVPERLDGVATRWFKAEDIALLSGC